MSIMVTFINRRKSKLLQVCHENSNEMPSQKFKEKKMEQEGQDIPVSFTWLLDKFQINWPFSLREEVQYRFSRRRQSWFDCVGV